MVTSALWVGRRGHQRRHRNQSTSPAMSKHRCRDERGGFYRRRWEGRIMLTLIATSAFASLRQKARCRQAGIVTHLFLVFGRERIKNGTEMTWKAHAGRNCLQRGGCVNGCFQSATVFGRKPCRFSPAPGFAAVPPGFRCAPNTSESFGECQSIGQLLPGTILFPGAGNATKRRRSCDEFSVSDPCVGEHKRGGWRILFFDDIPSKKPVLTLAVGQAVIRVSPI